MNVGSILVTATPIFTGLFLVNEDKMPIWMWLPFLVVLIFIGFLAGVFFDTRFGKKIKNTQDQWIGNHSEKKSGNQLHSVQ
jgi:hypothetical protein